MTRKFDAVVFDWYATLGAPAENDWWNKMLSMIEDAGGVIPAHVLTGWTTPELEHREASRSEAAYQAYEETQLYQLLRACGLAPEVMAELGPRIMELRDDEHITVFPDVVDLLEELRAAGTTLALCSNWSWDLDRHLVHNAVERYFDIVVCSAVVGYRKPHPGIFDVLLGELERIRPDLQRSRIAVVGDDWNADVEGAAASGLAPIHLARGGCDVTKHLAIPCAADLVELHQQLFEDGPSERNTHLQNDAQ